MRLSPSHARRRALGANTCVAWLALAPPAARAAASGLPAECGFHPLRIEEAIARHELHSRLAAGFGSTRALQVSRHDEVAVIQDDGTAVLDANPFDLANRALSFEPAGRRYRVRESRRRFKSAVGRPLRLAEDEVVEIPFGFRIDLEDHGDGTFSHERVPFERFSALDQYLMGLRSADEVADSFYVDREFDFGQLPSMPLAARRFDTTLRELREVEGPRDPAPASGGTLHLAFILLTRQGRRPARRPGQDLPVPAALRGVLRRGHRRPRPRPIAAPGALNGGGAGGGFHRAAGAPVVASPHLRCIFRIGRGTGRADEGGSGRCSSSSASSAGSCARRCGRTST